MPRNPNSVHLSLMRTWLLATPSPLSRMLCPLSSVSQHATLTLSFIYLSFHSLISPSGLLLFAWSEKVPGSNSDIFPAHPSHCHLYPQLLYPQPCLWVPASHFIKVLAPFILRVGWLHVQEEVSLSVPHAKLHVCVHLGVVCLYNHSFSEHLSSCLPGHTFLQHLSS